MASSTSRMNKQGKNIKYFLFNRRPLFRRAYRGGIVKIILILYFLQRGFKGVQPLYSFPQRGNELRKGAACATGSGIINSELRITHYALFCIAAIIAVAAACCTAAWCSLRWLSKTAAHSGFFIFIM